MELTVSKTKRGRILSLLTCLALITWFGGCDRDLVTTPPSPEPGEHIALVVNGLAETLSIVHLDDGSVDKNALLVGRWPNQVVVTSDGTMAYVVNSGDNSVQGIDLITMAISWSMDLGVGQNPWHLALWGEEYGCITNFLTGELAICDLISQHVLQRIAVGSAPEGVAVKGDVAYVAATGYEQGVFGAGSLAVVDLIDGSLSHSIELPSNAQGISVDHDGRVHVVCTGDYTQEVEGQVAIVDPHAGWSIDTVSVGGAPSSIVLADDGTAYIAGYWGGLMSYNWHTGELIRDSSCPLLDRQGLMSLALDDEAGILYVCDFEQDELIAFDLWGEAIVATYDVGDGPVSVALTQVPPGI
jgi:hypothetical protein